MQPRRLGAAVGADAARGAAVDDRGVTRVGVRRRARSSCGRGDLVVRRAAPVELVLRRSSAQSDSLVSLRVGEGQVRPARPIASTTESETHHTCLQRLDRCWQCAAVCKRLCSAAARVTSQSPTLVLGLHPGRTRQGARRLHPAPCETSDTEPLRAWHYCRSAATRLDQPLPLAYRSAPGRVAPFSVS
jgi:hypothetical protein